MHADQKLYLVFEFLDMDLKHYIEKGNAQNNPISLDIVKASTGSISLSLPPSSLPFDILSAHSDASSHRPSIVLP